MKKTRGKSVVKEVLAMLHIEFIRQARKNWNKIAVADSTGKELTYGRLLAASLWFSGYIRKNCKRDIVAVNLPPSLPAVIVNIALSLAGKTTTNTNYSVSPDVIKYCLELCEVDKVITSRKFEHNLARKFGFKPLPNSIYLEELFPLFTAWKKIPIFLAAKLLPETFLSKIFAFETRNEDKDATIIFSSGATGIPKGIILTHKNILANIRSVLDFSGWNESDSLLGVLPFFHSFGYTVTLWTPLVRGFKGCYHPNPMEAKPIGDLAKKHKATIIMGTNYFYQLYLRKITREQFSSLRFAILGAEKMNKAMAGKWEEKFGIPLLEGYGATELAPVVSCNIYDKEENGKTVIRRREGAIGKPLPGIRVRIVDIDSGEILAPGKTGMLEVKSPALMKGYYKNPEGTKKVVKDGWYITGDIAQVDEDGFITIKDRLSRFSKIGGEMVPHVYIEEAIHKALGVEETVAVVTSVPHEKKGERLVILHLSSVSHHFQPAKFQALISGFDIPNLWAPREFYQVEEIPILGSGKLDLMGIKNLAARACATEGKGKV